MHFKILPKNQTINTIGQNPQDFQHYYTNPNTNLVASQKLLELGWGMLSHPPFSSDLALSSYHLFRSVQNFLNGKIFNIYI